MKTSRTQTQSVSHSLNIYKLVFSSDIDVEEMVKAFDTHNNIMYANPNYILKAHNTPNDPKFASQQPNLDLLNMEMAWEFSEGSPSIIIAIIDSGIDWDHVDLKNKIWSNSDESVNGSDSDGNGYVDDIRGYDFVTISESGVVFGEDPGPPDNNPIDFDGHGTHVAGIAAADTNNALGIAGVGFDCTIMPLRAGYKAVNSVAFLTSDIINALSYAVNNGAHVVNMSFGGRIMSNALEDAIENALSNGLILVASAGNESEDVDTSTSVVPATYSGVIAVSATDTNGDFDNSYSNYGNSIHVAAPGEDILSTSFSSATNNDTYVRMSGTSMAAPHVSGLAALILSLNINANVSQLLSTTSLDKGASGKDTLYGYGLIQPHITLDTVETSSTSQPSIQLFGPGGVDSPILNAPNPFNPTTESTRIGYEINQAAEMSIYIYSLRLQLLKRLNRFNSSGYHEVTWNGKDSAGNDIPNGVYIIVVQAKANGETISKRTRAMVLR
ncbi:MAG: S8 family serine peptidase [Candidatus Margulisbacteria bacterium]|nr:S8 family serine peptidase [Candidatus Margulisiibacteriota bacterium]